MCDQIITLYTLTSWLHYCGGWSVFYKRRYVCAGELQCAIFDSQTQKRCDLSVLGGIQQALVLRPRFFPKKVDVNRKGVD